MAIEKEITTRNGLNSKYHRIRDISLYNRTPEPPMLDIVVEQWANEDVRRSKQFRPLDTKSIHIHPAEDETPAEFLAAINAQGILATGYARMKQRSEYQGGKDV